MKEKKKMSRKTLSTTLIIAGIIVCLIPVGARLYMHHQQKLIYEEFLAQQAAYEASLANMDSAFEVTEGAIEADSEAVERPAGIGVIKIPAIKCTQPILEGSTGYELKWGVGHITGTAMPGETGNCAIAGHRNSTYGGYFSRLGEVVTGDAITITYGGNDYSYTVSEIFVVTPDDVSVLRQGDIDGSVITLITCHPKGSNYQRLIVRAALDE